jgi:hypothetical protein
MPTPTCVRVQAPEITAELFVEVLGCLANLYLPEFDFFTLVCKHDLMPFLATYAQPGAGAHVCVDVTCGCGCAGLGVCVSGGVGVDVCG